MKAHRQGLLATVVSLFGASSAEAQTVFNWDPPPHANVFSTATNWTPAGPPGTTGEARFNTGGSPYSVSFNTDPTNARMRVGDDHVAFDLNGHTYTLSSTSTSSPSIMVGGVTLVDDALLTLTDGTLAGQHAVIAPATFQTAAGMVVSTGGALNLAGTFTIGKQRPGSLTIQNGGDVTSATGVLGESGAGDGSVTVTGNGSTWTNSGSVYVGGQAAADGGNGTLSIIDKGLVEIGGALKLWPGGTVALNGGTLQTPSLELAGGSFNWASGTFHTYGLAVDPSGILGDLLSVGAGKVLETDAEMIVGNGGTGSLSITGGYVDTGATLNPLFPVSTIGVGTLSNGSVVVSGGGQWVAHGGLILADQGVGSLEITSGLVWCVSANIGRSPGSHGEALVTGANTKWLVPGLTAVAGNLIVGGGGAGSINVTLGGEVDAQHLFIAVGPESVGTVNVDGPGSELLVDFNLEIGSGGVGTLAVTNGARVAVHGVTKILNGQLSGDGLVESKVENRGLVSPGTSPGALNIDGNYMQTTDGELLIELAAASSHDQLLITGTATLAGTLTVNLLNSFVPSPGQTFTMLTADDVDGTFTVEMLPSVPGRIFDVIYNPQSVVLTVLPAFTADFDEDGDVDSDDLIQWQGDFGMNDDSDADNDGDSDGDDFLAWQRQLGGGLPIVDAVETVSEPCALALALLVVCGLPLHRAPDHGGSATGDLFAKRRGA